jgi:hypothetical protein
MRAGLRKIWVIDNGGGIQLVCLGFCLGLLVASVINKIL